jgi:hypothetical protein
LQVRVQNAQSSSDIGAYHWLDTSTGGTKLRAAEQRARSEVVAQLEARGYHRVRQVHIGKPGWCVSCDGGTSIPSTEQENTVRQCQSVVGQQEVTGTVAQPGNHQVQDDEELRHKSSSFKENVPQDNQISPKGHDNVMDDTFRISVKTLNGRVMNFMAPNGKQTTVEKLKMTIAKREGIPIDQQKLICSNPSPRILQNDETFADANLESGSSLYLVLKCTGC